MRKESLSEPGSWRERAGLGAAQPLPDPESAVLAAHVRALAEQLGVTCAFAALALPGGRLARTVSVVRDGRDVPGFVYELDDLPCREVITKGSVCHEDGVWQRTSVGTALGLPTAESYVGARIPVEGRCLWLAVLDERPASDPRLSEAAVSLRAALAAAELSGTRPAPGVLEAQARLERLARARSAALRVGHEAGGRGAAESVRAERAPHVSEDKLARAFRSGPGLTAICSLADGRFLEASDALLSCLRLERAHVVGRTPDELGLRIDAADPGRFLRMLEKKGTIRNRELACRLPGGAERHVLVSAERLTLGGEDCVLATAVDITDRRRAENALRRGEERYALAVRGANDGLWDWDLRTGDIYFSHRWKEMLGHQEGEIRMGTREWFSRVHPDDRDRLGMEIVAHLEGLSPRLESEHRMKHRDGTWRFMLCRGLAVRDETGRAYRLAGSLTDVTERRTLEEQALHHAFHDGLTGLPNRALFMDRVGRAVERSKRNPDYAFAVLVADVDRFKVVNDGLGYSVGDALIRLIAERIEQCLRPEDTVARLGGDAFALLLEDIEDVSDATRVAGRLADVLRAPFVLGLHEVVANASVGVAVSTTGYSSAEELLRDADIALHRAKAHGRARCEVFDPAMHERALAQLEIETDLRRGLERGEFMVSYQPIVSLRSGELAGFEALLRWRHPRRGLVQPSEFVPAAEETGLILPLGEWILRASCRQAREWRERFGAAVPVSVNLSGRQLQKRDLVERIAGILHETGLPGHLLQLEITESAIMDNADSAAAMLGLLKELAVRVSIDDFGTGYSSFSLLHRLPIDTLKVDRSFVSRIPGKGTATVRAIVALAHNLGMQVVAEGVETSEQRSALVRLECAYGQGHLFAEAVPADLAAELILGGPRW